MWTPIGTDGEVGAFHPLIAAGGISYSNSFNKKWAFVDCDAGILVRYLK